MSPYSITVCVGTILCMPEYIFRRSCYSVSLQHCEQAASVLTQFSFQALRFRNAFLSNHMLSPGIKGELGHHSGPV